MLHSATSELSFDALTHTYRVGDEVLISVTQALKLADVIDYSMIPQDVLRAAAERGTYVHQMIHLWLDGDLVIDRVPQAMIGYLDAARRFLDDTRFEPLRVECRDYHRVDRYAGTYDLHGFINGSDGDEATVDWKTGLIMAGHAIQLVGYSNLRRLPRAARRVAVKLNADGTYKAHEYPSSQHPENTFAHDDRVWRSALECAKWNSHHHTV